MSVYVRAAEADREPTDNTTVVTKSKSNVRRGCAADCWEGSGGKDAPVAIPGMSRSWPAITDRLLSWCFRREIDVGCECLAHALCLPRTPLLPLVLTHLVAPALMDQRPALVPLPATEPAPQRQERIEIAGCPVHPTPFHPGFDHQLAGALYHAAANR